MRDAKLWRIWEVLYPVGIYFVVTNLAMAMVGAVWKLTNENYMAQQIIATAVAFPFLYSFCRRNPAPVWMGEVCSGPEESGGGQSRASGQLLRGIALAAAVALAGLALNNLIGYTGLKERSQSYREVADAFYGGSLWLEIPGSCLLIPVMEELLYRGIVYHRLRSWMKAGLAVPVSALIFGAMHFNLVQFIYAGCIGMLLALVMEHSGLLAAMGAHMLTNLISVLRSETEWFDFMQTSRTASVICTVIAAALSAGLFLSVCCRRRETWGGTDKICRK